MRRYGYSLGVMVIWLLFSLMGCGHKSETTPGQGPIMSLADSIPIPESSILYQSTVLDMAIDDSGHFYMSDNTTRRILQTEPPFTRCWVLGGPGLGPGEYFTPWFLDVSEGYLFYSNLGSSLIKSMNIKHNTTTKTQDISVPAVASHVLVYQDTLVIYNDVNIPPLRVYSIHTSTPQLIGKGVRTEQRYELAARRVAASGGLDVSRDGIIYTIPVSHFAIHAYNMQAKFLSTLDIQDPPHYVPFSNDLYKQSQSEKTQEWQEAIVSFSHIYGLWLVQCQDGSQDVVVESHLPNTESNVHVYHFIDLATGRILQTNLLRNVALKAVQGSKLYFFQSRQQKDGSWNLVAMKVYRYNL